MGPTWKQLCSHCTKLIPPKNGQTSTQNHYPNLSLLQQSSKRCVTCKLIQDQWSLEAVQQRFPEIDERSYESITVTVKVDDVRISEAGCSWALLNAEFEIPSRAFIYERVFSVQTCDSRSASANMPLWKVSTSSIPEKLSMLKTWLHDCVSKHPDCTPAVGQLPKRLIDVGSEDGRPVRLVLSEQLEKGDVRYATLSYCWGDSNFSVRRDKVDLYSQEIPVELIPPTYQDALSIARALHIPYLWIDALCIVQDDHLEWQREAPRMQEIYSGSWLTIAASDAPDTSVGCFPRSDQPTGSPSNGLGNEPDPTSGIFVTTGNNEADPTTILRMQRDDIRNSTDDSILNTRGWVLQEMILSHRTVHCMHAQLQWQCRTACRTETGLEFETVGTDRQSLPILPSAGTGTNTIWWKWMENYSQRRFSFASDRGPAMAGVTKHYAAVTGDASMLGLWERSAHQDLLWIRTDELPKEVESTPRPLNMPSWSWLSCPAAISFDYWRSLDEDEFRVDVRDHAALVDWDVAWAGEPLTSGIETARLVIDGPVREIDLAVAPEAADFNPPYFDVWDEKPDLESNPIPWRCSGQFDAETRSAASRYLCLLLRSRTSKVVERVKEVFLMLEPSMDGQAETTYRRVGLAQIRGERPTFDLAARMTLILV